MVRYRQGRYSSASFHTVLQHFVHRLVKEISECIHEAVRSSHLSSRTRADCCGTRPSNVQTKGARQCWTVIDACGFSFAKSFGGSFSADGEEIKTSSLLFQTLTLVFRVCCYDRCIYLKCVGTRTPSGTQIRIFRKYLNFMAEYLEPLPGEPKNCRDFLSAAKTHFDSLLVASREDTMHSF